MAEDKKKCFIIMPITTPEHFLDKYRDGNKHFEHVLECFFIPAIQNAGYQPVPPKAKGSDLIHAEIIKNLENADLVLCDMSCLNPNVFFEFGIRTALNHPVCVVKDELTKTVPFDTGILNYQSYKSTIEPWELPDEIKKLAEHLSASSERSKDENTLWKYFGLRSEARPYEGKTGMDAKIDYLTMQFDSLRQQIGNLGQSSASGPYEKGEISRINEISQFIQTHLPESVEVLSFDFDQQRGVRFFHGGNISGAAKYRIRNLVRRKYDTDVQFILDPEE